MQSSPFPEIERFYYVRHGKTTDNRDVALTEEGAQAAAALAPLFTTLRDVTSIFCSPMIRAKSSRAAFMALCRNAFAANRQATRSSSRISASGGP